MMRYRVPNDKVNGSGGVGGEQEIWWGDSRHWEIDRTRDGGRPAHAGRGRRSKNHTVGSVCVGLQRVVWRDLRDGVGGGKKEGVIYFGMYNIFNGRNTCL